MKNYLFDLDGTIVDSGTGIMESIRYALEQFGILDPDEEDLHKCIGPSLLYSFTCIFHLTQKDAEEAIHYYREVYAGGNMFHLDLYPGMEGVLKTLQKKHKTIILVTSKPEAFAVPILSQKGLRSYFTYISSPSLTEQNSDKTRLIRQALETCDLKKEETMMIGDTRFDKEGAEQAGVSFAAALYGYGSKEEIQDAAYLIYQPMDILKI